MTILASQVGTVQFYHFFFVDGTREAAGTTSRVKLNYRYIYSVFLDVLRSRDAGSLILFASC